MGLFKKKPPPIPTCVFCGRDIQEHEMRNQLAIEHADGESTLGHICDRCADGLDSIDDKSDWESMQNVLGEDLEDLLRNAKDE